MKNNTTEQMSVAIELMEKNPSFPDLKTNLIYDAAREAGMKYKDIKSSFLVNKVSWGVYRIDRDMKPLESISDGSIKIESPVVELSSSSSFKLNTSSNTVAIVPEADPTFIQWGEFKSIKAVIESNQFFPLYISGMSGNGKTMMVEQACAKTKRKYVRLQISPETDEDDLIGGFRLVNGETVFHKGPVITAMEEGCILLIDELDRGTNKIMCLQGVLEGKPVLIKKTGETAFPAPGFNVIATANSKGRGSDDGRYSAAQIIDDAFIERFVASIDQPYPEFNVEKKIVSKVMESLDIKDDEFAEKLVSWSSIIRKTYQADGVDEVVSTRRLCHIVKAYGIFNDRLTAIKMCITRFEEETREAFLDLYTKIDGEVGKDLGDLSNESHTEQGGSSVVH